MTDDVAVVLELERSRLRALVERDMLVAERIHPSDYQLITPGGHTHTKATYLGDVASRRLEYLAFEPTSAIAVRGQHLTSSCAGHRRRAVRRSHLSLPVYVAFGEAGHLAAAAGTAAAGLALLGLSRAAAVGLWSTPVARGTGAAGVLLIAAAVIGPVSIAAYALWLLIISVLLLRRS